MGRIFLNNSVELENVLTFSNREGEEIIRIESNGNIYVKDRLIKTDEEVNEGLKIFLRSYGILPSEPMIEE